MSKPRQTENLILGSGLAGLTLAAYFEKAGMDYLIVDSQDEIGGLTRSLEYQGFHFDFGMKSAPIGQNIHENPLFKLKEELGLQYGIEPWTESPITFEKGEFKPFVGFGEKLHTTQADELSYYALSPRILVSGGFGTLISELKNRIPDKKILLKRRVTALRGGDEKITAAVLNGDEVIQATNYISTLPPVLLAGLLPPGLISTRTAQRLSGKPAFFALSLEIATDAKVSDQKNMIFLSESGEDPLHMVGMFLTNTDPIRAQHRWQVSTWLSLLDHGIVQDEEAVAHAIRSMKKLIQKAYPLLLSQMKWERILAVEDAVGFAPALTLEKNSSLPGVENLFLAGAQARNAYGVHARNVLAALETALILAAKFVREKTARAEQAKPASTPPDLGPTEPVESL